MFGTNVREQRWVQSVDTTLYLQVKRWSVAPTDRTHHPKQALSETENPADAGFLCFLERPIQGIYQMLVKVRVITVSGHLITAINLRFCSRPSPRYWYGRASLQRIQYPVFL